MREKVLKSFFFLFLFRVLNPNGPRERSNVFSVSVPRLSSFRERFFLKDFIHIVKEKFSALKRTTEEETLRTTSSLSFRTTTLLLLLLLLEREAEEEKKGRK
jgi:hypothetical protein